MLINIKPRISIGHRAMKITNIKAKDESTLPLVVPKEIYRKVNNLVTG
mgnify:CR=1 FL=1